MNNEFIKKAFLITTIPIYALFLIFKIKNLEYTGDTENYFINFESIESFFDVWVYGIEFFVPLLFFIYKKIDLSFEFFLFFTSFIWIYIYYRSKYYFGLFGLIFLLVFMMSDYFFGNNLYLIRTYYAAIFFIIYKESKIKIFIFLSIISHTSSLLWLFLSWKKTNKYLFLNKYLFIFSCIFISALGFLDFFQIFLKQILILIYNLEIYTLNRKIIFYLQENDLSVDKINYLTLFFIFLNFIIAIFKILKSKELDKTTSLHIFFLLNMTILFFFHENSILANRLAFFSYYFSIPYFLFNISKLGNKLCLQNSKQK